MKTAIVYYSLSGNSQYTAEEIAKRLAADVIRIEPKKEYPQQGFKKYFWAGKSAVMGERPALQPYTFDAAQYDQIILGMPVWAGNFTPPIRTFIDENPEIRSKRLAAFVCFSGGGADKALARLKSYLGVEHFAAELILIDPRDKMTEENTAKIEEFCSQIK